MATSFNWSRTIQKCSNISQKMRYGESLYRLQEALKCCMMPRSFTEIWRAQTYFWTKMELPFWVIWMSVKLPKKDCCTRRQEHHIMQVQRSGKISHTITNQTYGHLDASYMRLLHWNHHSEPTTCKVSTRKSLKDSTPKYLTNLAVSWTN